MATALTVLSACGDHSTDVAFTGTTVSEDRYVEMAAAEAQAWSRGFATTTTAPPAPPKPKPQKIAPPSGGVKPRPPATGVNWDAIAQCESGGNWSINTGNGYYGGLQMDMNFWRSYNNASSASRPDLATREEQIVAATNAYNVRGLRPWPHCGRYG